MKNKTNILNYFITVILAVALFMAIGFNVIKQKQDVVNASTYTYEDTTARTFNSQTSFNLSKNGNNGFIAMSGQTCQNLAEGYGTKVGFDGTLSNTPFSNVLSATFDNQYFQGTHAYTLVGQTAMLVDSVTANADSTAYRAVEVPVRAFKFPISGSVSVKVTAWMDAEYRTNSLSAVVSHNASYLGDSVLLQDFDESGTMDANDKWEYTTSLQVTANDMLYVEVHNGRTSASTSYSTAHTVIEVEYTQTTDATVAAVKEQITSLPSEISASDVDSVIGIYDKIAIMSDLQRSFITSAEGNKIQTAYNTVSDLVGNRIFNSNEHFSSVVQGNGNYYYMHGSEDVNSFALSTEVVTIENVDYWKGSSPYTLQTNDKMICNGAGSTDYPIRAFKVPMSGKIKLSVSARMIYGQSIGDPFTIHVYNGTGTVNELQTTLNESIWSNGVELNVDQEQFIYITVRNTGNVAFIEAQLQITVQYLESSDTNVVNLNAYIENLESLDNITKNDYDTVKANIRVYENLSLLQKDFVSDTADLYSAYDKSFALNTQDKIDNLPDTVTLATVGQVNEITAILNGMTQTQKDYISTTSLTKYQTALCQVEVINSLSEFYSLIDALPSEIREEDETQVNSLEIYYETLTQEQKDALDVSYLNKYNLAVKTVSDYKTANRIMVDVEALPSIDALTVAYIQSVKALYVEYNALEDIAKQNVTNIDKLTQAVAVVGELEVAQNQANMVIEQISGLGEITSLEQEGAILSALQNYNQLSQTAKEMVNNYNKLQLAVIKIDKLHAKQVSDLILNLPAVITLADETNVLNARRTYNDLTEEQKTFVTNLNVLTNAEQEIQNLKNQATSISSSKEQGSATSKSEEISYSSASIQQSSSSNTASATPSKRSGCGGSFSASFVLLPLVLMAFIILNKKIN